MELRRFTDNGLTRAREWVDDLQTGRGDADSAAEFLTTSTHTAVVGEVDDETVPAETPVDRFTAATILYDNLAPLVEVGRLNPAVDGAMWTWLALAWRDHLLRPPSVTNRTGEIARFVSEPGNSLRYYRHLLAGPYLVYAAHADEPEVTRVVLDRPLTSPGEFAGQLAASQDISSNRGLMDAATQLYWDPVNGSTRSGRAGKKPGSVRRFAVVVSQFERTFDLGRMDGSQVRALLPLEFQFD